MSGKAARLPVSIHAPARGATLHRKRLSPLPMCFNPRAREGRDLINCVEVEQLHKFQSTRPRGARLSSP